MTAQDDAGLAWARRAEWRMARLRIHLGRIEGAIKASRAIEAVHGWDPAVEWLMPHLRADLAALEDALAAREEPPA